MGASACIKYLALTALLFNGAVFGADLVVCSKCEYKTIAGAAASAAAGSVLRIKPGVYRESNIVIQKPMRIIGDAEGEKPVVDGGGHGNVFLVNSSDVEISGLEIKGSGFSDIEDLAGIKVMDSERCRIVNNVLSENTFGIYLGRSRNCLIESNYASSRIIRGSPAGNGIHIWNGERVVVLNNHLEKNRDGIYFEFVKNSRIFKNRSNDNYRYGLHFMFSNEDEYRDNFFERNGSGVAVMYSKNINMVNNRFERSLGGGSYGILLKDIASSNVQANVFKDNTVGAALDGTTRSAFIGNIFETNGWAVRVLGNSDTNTFENNNFSDNTFEVSTNSMSDNNQFKRNFWSSYNGIDLDGDGTGDSPYFPMRLSILLMERYGVTVLLMKSFFFTILDQAENAFPVLTPEVLRDDQPQMKPVRVKL